MILQKSCEFSKINEIYLLWTLSEPIFSIIIGTFLSTQSVSRYHGCRRGCQERGVVVRGTARARLALSFFPSSSLSFLSFPSFLPFFLFVSFLFLEGTERARLAGVAFYFLFLFLFSFLFYFFFLFFSFLRRHSTCKTSWVGFL